MGTNKENILFTHALLRHLSPNMAFSGSHFFISQYGKLWKGLLWCSNNFSRASPIFELVSGEPVKDLLWCSINVSKAAPLELKPSHPFLLYG